MANVWREPIFDRTLNDVTFALLKIAEWKKAHTHKADVKVENDKLVLYDEGTAYVEDDSFVHLNSNGVAYVEDDVLVTHLGVVYDLKGCLNLSDISRIEGNTAYLAERLTEYRYSLNVDSREWERDGLPTAQDMSRIVSNIRSLISGFVKPRDAAIVPDGMLSYTDINALEYNLHLLKQLLDAMVEGYIKSGTHKCGATTRLPIRR